MEEEKIFVVKEISEMKDDKNINDDHDNEFPFFHDNEDNDVEKNANIEEEKNINEPEINENIIQESKIGKIQEENNGIIYDFLIICSFLSFIIIV